MNLSANIQQLLTSWHQMPLLFKMWLGVVLAAICWNKYGVQLRNEWDEMRDRSAESWPATEGTILSGDVKEKKQGRGNIRGYMATLIYSYSAGERETGKRKRFFEVEQEADDWVRDMKDRRVQIRVQPGKPKYSRLLLSDIAVSYPVSSVQTIERLPFAAIAAESSFRRFVRSLVIAVSVAGFAISLGIHIWSYSAPPNTMDNGFGWIFSLHFGCMLCAGGLYWINKDLSQGRSTQRMMKEMTALAPMPLVWIWRLIAAYEGVLFLHLWIEMSAHQNSSSVLEMFSGGWVLAYASTAAFAYLPSRAAEQQSHLT